jgi:hypothetical protein
MTDPTKPESAADAPSPEPHPVWPQEEWNAAAPTTPPAQVLSPASPPPQQGGAGLAGLVIVAVFLAAILSSLGTFLVLSATGHLNTTSTADTGAPAAAASPVAPGGGNQGGAVPQPTAGPGQGGATPAPGGTVPVPNPGDQFGDQFGGLFGGLLGDMFGGIPVLDDVSRALGVTTDQLVAELQQLRPGDGICTLATKHNVDCGTVKSAVRDAVKSQLDNAVTAGDLNQQMANGMLGMVDLWLASGGNLPSFPMGNGPGSGSDNGNGPGNGAGPGSSPGMGDQATNRPWIGVYYVELDPATARDLNAPIDHGALIQKPEESDQPAVQPGSPAAFAGLREDDIVVAMDGQQIDATHSLRDLVLAHKPGDIARLEIQRNGQAFTVSVTLGTRPAGQ